MSNPEYFVEAADGVFWRRRELPKRSRDYCEGFVDGLIAEGVAIEHRVVNEDGYVVYLPRCSKS